MTPEPAGTLAALKAAFDGSFAAPAQPPADDEADIIVIRLGDATYALDVRDLAGLQARKRCVPLPGGPAGMEGIVGIRGRIVPVWDLARALGLPGGPRAGGPEGWLALVQHAGEPVALAFGGLAGYRRVPAGRIHPTESPQPFVRAVLHDHDLACGVLALPDIVRTLVAQEKTP